MTTTTEVELFEDEATVEVSQLTKTQAKALDKRIRSASDKLSTASENLLDLLEQAAAGAIHVALELPSWTAWFKDAVQIQVSDRFERKELAKLMSGKGMSQRAIAGSLGVSQKTIDRDLADEEIGEGETVMGLDGAERPKQGKAKEPEVIDAEVVDVEEDSGPMTAVDIVSAFDDEMANLWSAKEELVALTEEAKFAGARNRIVKADLGNLEGVIASLSAIVADLKMET